MIRAAHSEPKPAGLSFPRTGEVHLWKIDLSEVHWPSGCPQVLDAAERARYVRFRFSRDAGRFAQRRAALRQILGWYLEADPSALTFEVSDAAGKPCLSAPLKNELRFNVSSSQEIALIAVGRDSAIGVDIEAVRSDIDFTGIAGRFFTKGELARLQALPDTKRLRGFYRLWTSKEALLKAVGTGLPGGLDRFDVGADPDRPPELIRDAGGGRSLFLYPSDLTPGYFGALALDHADAEIAEFAFPTVSWR